MKISRTPLGPLAAAAVLVFAACGSDDPSADSVDPPGSELRAPTPIEATGVGNAASASGDEAARAEMATLDADTADIMIAPAHIVAEYIVGPDLPALPDNTTGYLFDPTSEITADDVATIATALGLEDEPVQLDEDWGAGWRLGPDDGSAASLHVWDDALRSWNYNAPWDDRDLFACEVAGAVEPGRGPDDPSDAVADPGEGAGESGGGEDAQPGDEPAEPLFVGPDDDCPTPEPPSGVPDAATAEQLAGDILTDLGVDTDAVQYDTFADEWSANVSASAMFDGVVPLNWGFSFGGDARLDFAWGNAATPEPVGPYELIDLDAAIERLESGAYGYAFASARDIAITRDAGVEVEPADEVTTDDVVAEPAEPIESDEPVDRTEGEIEEQAMPMPVDDFEVTEITVTLVDVEADLWWVWDVHGAAWLVPAYRFIGDEGGWYTVPAVTDDFLVQVQPPEPEPLPTPVDPEPVDPAPIDLTGYIGLPLDEFTAAIEELGYPVRVVEIDGEGLVVTMDFVPHRVNVAVETRDDAEYVVDAVFESDGWPGDGGEPRPDPVDPVDPDDHARFLGLPLDEYAAEVEALGYEVRVVEIDGEALVVTDDFNPNRLNVAVETRDSVEHVVAAGSDVDLPVTAPSSDVVPIVGVFEDISYYPACGNEILEHEGAKWHPINRDQFPVEYERAVGVDREASPATSNEAALGFAPRVPDPGVGDDVGTLVVWDDGVAHFISDSGRLETWLTAIELEYFWEC